MVWSIFYINIILYLPKRNEMNVRGDSYRYCLNGARFGRLRASLRLGQVESHSRARHVNNRPALTTIPTYSSVPGIECPRGPLSKRVTTYCSSFVSLSLHDVVVVTTADTIQNLVWYLIWYHFDLSLFWPLLTF